MRQNALLEKLVADQLRTDIPEFRAGDSVRVHARIVEGSRERVQMFEGVVIKRKGTGIQALFVRFLTVLVWSVRSHCTHHVLTRSK